MRQCLAEEFSSIYVFHLRGNQRTSGDVSRREGGKIFGSGSRAPIAISLLVKNPQAKQHGKIHIHDIGDYLNREEKLTIIREFASTAGIGLVNGWQTVVPDSHGDWLKQRDGSFSNFIVMGDKKGDAPKVFENYSLGIATGRDTWCFNASKSNVLRSMGGMVDFYNAERKRFNSAHAGHDRKARESAAESFINTDATCISWTRALKSDLAKDKEFDFNPDCITKSLYRPYSKQWLYFDRCFNEMVYLMPRLYPAQAAGNLAIMIKGNWRGEGQLALMVDRPVCLQPDGGGQCFPLYLYDKPEESGEDDLFGKNASTPTRRDAITDAGLSHFQRAYPAKGEGETITKEDLFYYIYGLLHSPDYRSRYADNLGKELPRIPAVKTFADFMAFSKAGRELAHWHLNYETVECHPGVTVDLGTPSPSSASLLSPEMLYRVTKMKFGKKKDPATGKSVNDKTTVIYNEFITLRNIPLEAYDYIVNGKPALEWVMERQAVTTDKDSGITNDANLWATETMGNPKYPLELFLRVVTVGLETNRIVAGLPELEISVESSS